MNRQSPRRRATRPVLEALEGRQLLYATTGAQWVKPVRITYSFAPDGTDIGGVASNLQATFNARFGTDVWKQQFTKAAAVWQKYAKVNFDLVPDDGSPIGVAGSQQGDPRFGDIRIGGFAQPSNVLAFAYLPPQINGGPSAGDILLNTSQSWQINGTTYDVMTVALHELGHALGLHHSTYSTAVMWTAYTGAKQAPTTDDIGGIRQVYNARQNDFFDANGANNGYISADNISGYLNASGQLTLSALDSTTPLTIASGDNDWMKITVPPTSTGTMVVKMQSKQLSLLSPSISIYNASATSLLAQQSSLAHGDTVSVSISGVTPGQTYLILAKGATTGSSGFGSYALQVNFGSAPLSPIALPSTTLEQRADQGGGTLQQGADDSGEGSATIETSEIGDPGHFWVYDEWDDEAVPEEVSATLDTSPKDSNQATSSIKVGQLVGKGHVMSITGTSAHDGDHEDAEEVIDLTPRGAAHPANHGGGAAGMLLGGSRPLVEPRAFDALVHRMGEDGDALSQVLTARRGLRGRPGGRILVPSLGDCQPDER
jgi:hypothetical protein